MDEDGRRRHGPAAMGTDCISALPDELLHDILLRLESTRAAGRTSVLSRRWRHVWGHLPDLVFDGSDTDSDSDDSAAPPPPAASFPDSIDSALRAYSAPTLDGLNISLPSGCPAIPARRVRSWLRFASHHQVRRLHLDVPWLHTRRRKAGALVLPTIDRAQYISISLGHRWRLRIRPASVFTALTDLTIHDAIMEARVLEALVFSQCPHLCDLSLSVTLQDDESDISLRSNSLEILSFCVDNTRQVEIVAPRMERLWVSELYASKTQISAPKLAELVWDSDPDDSDIQFNDTSLHLRVLEVSDISASSMILKGFNKVDELRLNVKVSKKIVAYERFMNDANHLPKCGTLSVSFLRNYHGFAPSMLHLLRKCNSVRNFTVYISKVESSTKSPSCRLPCPCRLPDSWKVDDINLNSLEVVTIDLYKGSHEVVEFVKQLSQGNTAVLNKVVINYLNKSVNIKESFCAEVRSVCRPNIKVEFIVYGSDEKRACLV